MYKTLKEIADELNISKQKVYRYVKDNHIIEAVQNGQVKQYDEAVQEQIKQHFSKNEPHQKPHREAHQNRINDAVYEALIKQLEIKDAQIEKLQTLLDQEQQLNALNQQKLQLLENKETVKKHWWNKKKEI